MALDFADNVDPPDWRLSPERLAEIRELSRCEEFLGVAAKTGTAG